MNLIIDSALQLLYLSYCCLDDFRNMRLDSGIVLMETIKLVLPRVKESSAYWCFIDINMKEIYEILECL